MEILVFLKKGLSSRLSMEVSTYQRLMCSCSYDGRSNGRNAIKGCNKIDNDGQHYCIDIVDIRDNKKYVFAGCGSHKYFAERTFGQWGGYVSANIYALKQRPRLLTQRVIFPCAYRNSNSATLVSSDLRAQISGSISWKHCFFYTRVFSMRVACDSWGSELYIRYRPQDRVVCHCKGVGNEVAPRLHGRHGL